MAGILLEAGQIQGMTRLGIGIGVNIESAPEHSAVEEGAVPPVSVVGKGGQTMAPEGFLTLLAAAFAGYEQTYQSYGFEPIRTRWLQSAARLGEPIRARTVTEEHHGTFETVDADGALVLTTPKGRLAIPAADVYF